MNSADPSRTALTVIIADDAPLIRRAIRSVLTGAGMAVIAEVGSIPELHDAVDRLLPDLAVIDIRFPPTYSSEGMDAAFALRQRHVTLGLLIVSQHIEPVLAAKLLRETGDAVGYLLKDRAASIDSFVDAALSVGQGGVAFDPEVVAAINTADARLSALTRREKEVLALLAEGLSNRAISGRLYLSEKTVEAHIGKIVRQLGIPSDPGTNRRVLAVRAFLECAVMP